MTRLLQIGDKLMGNSYSMEHKLEILNTRVGGAGSSDAAMVERIGRQGIVALTATDKKRLAILTGQAEKTDNFQTHAMQLGDEVEEIIFQIIKRKHPTAVSNPYREDLMMSSFYGFSIFNHIDIEVETEETVVWYEVKASNHTTEEVLDTYKAQLQWHWMLFNKVHRGKKLSLFLVHYRTGITESFSAENLSVIPVKLDSKIQGNLYSGLLKLRAFLPTFEWVEDDSLSLSLVDDERIQAMREVAEDAILRINELQAQIDEFKTALCSYMMSHSIKKISADKYTITLTLPTTSTTIDSKRLKAEMPDVYSQFLKTTSRKASVTIKTN